MDNFDFALDRIMIIDDNYVDRYVAERMITKNQFAREISAFDMAGKALDYIERHIDKPEVLPQVILLDISMPLMDGFAFLEKLKDISAFQNSACNVFMLTSSLSTADQDRAGQFPIVKKFINKPLSATALNTIRNIQGLPADATAA